MPECFYFVTVYGEVLIESRTLPVCPVVMFMPVSVLTTGVCAADH